MNSLKQQALAVLTRAQMHKMLWVTMLSLPLLLLMPELAYASNFEPLNKALAILKGLFDLDTIAVIGTLALLVVLYRIYREKASWEAFGVVLLIIGLAAAAPSIVNWVIGWFR